MGKQGFVCASSRPTTFSIREEKIGRIHSVEGKKHTTQRVRPMICKSRQTKMVTNPVRVDSRQARMGVSGVRSAVKGERPVMLKVFLEEEIFGATTAPNVLTGVHYVGQEVTLTAFQSPIVLSPTVGKSFPKF